MTYFNPDQMTGEERLRIDRWLLANGCRYDVALEPVIVRGNVIEFYSLCKRGYFAHKGSKKAGGVRIKWDHVGDPRSILTRRRLRLRVPLSRVR